MKYRKVTGLPTKLILILYGTDFYVGAKYSFERDEIVVNFNDGLLEALERTSHEWLHMICHKLHLADHVDLFYMSFRALRNKRLDLFWSMTELFLRETHKSHVSTVGKIYF